MSTRLPKNNGLSVPTSFTLPKSEAICFLNGALVGYCTDKENPTSLWVCSASVYQNGEQPLEDKTKM